MYWKKSDSLGFPHSSYSGTVSGSVASSMVFITSTKGTWVTTARNRSGRRLATAPISRPAFDGHPRRVAVAGGGQVLDSGDEVREGVALDQHLAGVVPGLAQV